MSVTWHTSVRSKVVSISQKDAPYIFDDPDFAHSRWHFTPIPDIEPELRRAEARKRVVKAWFWIAGIALLGLALWVAERWKP